ncbi:MAG: ribonuclease P protein subunit [Candidatus Woesearchaeota archaeon]
MEARRALLIGKRVTITASKNKSVKGMCGIVKDETKNTFTILTEKGNKKVIKKQCVFEFEIEGKKIQVKGEEINKRPEDRVGMKTE